MWNPIKIEINNLFANRETVYEFKNNSCTVIFGKNETDRGLENNGAGKTTIFEAISIALTNESLRSIKKESFINRDAEDCKVVMYLKNAVLKMDLKIERIFFRGNKPVKVKIWENGEQNKQIVSVREANKRVLELIGISREDLLRYFIISQDNNYTFFTASDVEKKEIMNRITSADMINPVIEELAARQSARSDELSGFESHLDRLSSKVELLKEQEEEILAADDTDDELELINGKIGTLTKAISRLKSEAKVLKEELRAKNDEVFGIVIDDTTELRNKKSVLEERMDVTEGELNENRRVIRKLKLELDSAITCPECGHEFINESDLDLPVTTAKILLKDARVDIDKKKKKIEKIKTSISKLKMKINTAKETRDEVEALEDEAIRINRAIKRNSENATDHKEKIEKLKLDIETIKNKKRDDKLLNSIKKRIADFEKDIEDTNNKLIPVSEELDKIKFWQFNMGKAGFMTYLANKSVKIIEGITNSYLRKFKVDISILINGFKILKSGSVREKIDIFVSNDGLSTEEFLAKSGGERGRVTLAGVLGIQHLINLSTNGKGLNLLLLDEVFPGIDSMGQGNVIKILDKMGITVMLISQNINEDLNIKNKIFVKKEDKVSTIIEL